MGDGAPSVLTIVNLGTEGSYGGGASSPIVVPITGGSATGLYEPILDQGKRGIAARDFGSYKGPVRAEASLEGDAYNAVIDILAASIIGAGGSLSSSPSSLGMILSGGSGSAKAVGLGVTDLTIRFNRAEGALTYSASMIGQKVTSEAALSVAHDVGKPLMGWNCTITMGDVVGCLIEGEWSLSREWALLYCGTATPGGIGEEYPSNIYAGPLEVTARFTVDFVGQADLDVAIDKTQGAVTTVFEDEDDANTLTIAAPLMDYADGPFELDHSGTFVTLVYSCRALYKTADSSGPITIT